MAATMASTPSIRPIAIGFGVDELQWIVRLDAGVLFDPVLAVKKREQPLARGEPEMVATLRANAQGFDQIFGVDDRVALGTFDPEPLGHAAGFVGRGNRLARLLEPRHSGELSRVRH
jgi:hypothetical protein